MKLVRRQPGEATTGFLMALGLAVVIAAVGATTWVALGLPLPGCRFREATGIPCAGCGTTRMFRALGSGEFGAALRFNPLAFSVLSGGIGLAAIEGLRRMAGHPGWRLVWHRLDWIWIAIGVFGALGANWAYLVRAGI